MHEICQGKEKTQCINANAKLKEIKDWVVVRAETGLCFLKTKPKTIP
jgi:hypothetical protein